MCSAGRPSLWLIFSPANSAAIHAGSPAASASRSSAARTSFVSRSFDRSTSQPSHDHEKVSNRAGSAAKRPPSVVARAASRRDSRLGRAFWAWVMALGAPEGACRPRAYALQHNRLGRTRKIATIDASCCGATSVVPATRPPLDTRFPAMTQPPSEAPDKDLPLREDTRLLGRLLGDVLREQAGDAVYARIEAIRQTAIRFRRAGPDLAPAVKSELDALLSGLPIAETLHVVRAFSYFSHLANIAEDVHQNRRRRAHALAGSPPQRGSLADAVERVAAHGTQADALLQWFGQALIAPVLTAHPTEVQRKSILDCEREIARLLQWRERVQLTRDEIEELDGDLQRQVLTLWQTAMIRLEKLKVKDEIENGLAYYRYTFLAEVPKIYAALEAHARRRFALSGFSPPPFLRLGSWIGGDRDGNPFVVAETLDYAIRAQSAVALAHYLDEVHALGGELSLSTRLVEATPELLGLAAAANDTNPHRSDEPYRQALIGVYARLAATARELAAFVPARAPHGSLAPYAAPRELLADLGVVRDSLTAHGAPALADPAPGAAAPRGRGVRLPPRRDRPAPELRRARGGRRRAACRRRRRRRLRGVAGGRARRPARARARQPRGSCTRRTSTTRRGSAPSSRSSSGGGDPRPLRRRRAAQLRDLEVPVGVRPAGSRRAAEGSGAAQGRRAGAQHRAAVRDHRRPRALRRDHGRGVRAAALPALARRARRVAGGDAGLFGQQQGRRLRHRQLGAVPGRAHAGRAVRRAAGSSCASSTAAAAPSAAAAARATRRFSPSRPAASAAACASPSRARSSPASTRTRRSGAAISRRWSPPRSRAACSTTSGWATVRRSTSPRWKRCRGTPAGRTVRSSTRRPPLSSTSGRRRRSPKSRASTSAAGRRRGPRRRESRTCARFPGCSAGASAG